MESVASTSNALPLAAYARTSQSAPHVDEPLELDSPEQADPIEQFANLLKNEHAAALVNREFRSDRVAYRDIPTLPKDQLIMLQSGDDVWFPRNLAPLSKTELTMNDAGWEASQGAAPMRELAFVKAPPAEIPGESGTRNVRVLTSAGSASIQGFAASDNGVDRYLVLRTSPDCAGLKVQFGLDAPY